MDSLEQMYSCLSLFSDLNWSEVIKEYESLSSNLTFPEYLQEKCLEGDCPPYLYELAFYEMARSHVETFELEIPQKPGLYLNPSLVFLNFEFDVKKMLEEASLGQIHIYERTHILCLYRNKTNQVNAIEITNKDLEILQTLEDGPLFDGNFPKKTDQNQKLIDLGMIINSINP
jgi:hypothetical protein